mgnify:CR=1 FL=1
MQRGEGFRGLRQWEDANKAFQEAEKARPKDPEVKVRYGFLFMEHWQPGDAAGAFNEVVGGDGRTQGARGFGEQLQPAQAVENGLHRLIHRQLLDHR